MAIGTSRLHLLAAAIAVLTLLSTLDAAPARAGVVQIPDIYENAYLSDVFDWAGVTRNHDNGLPMVRYRGLSHPQWNYVTVALYGLQRWSAWVHHHGTPARADAIRAADFLVAHQGADGAWRYTFAFTYSDDRVRQRLPAGWIAAQAQGNAISLLSRMYAATGERGYLLAAIRGLQPFSRRVGAGGIVVDYDAHHLLAGFPTATPTLTLEDYELALIGVADLAPHSTEAQTMLSGLMANFYWSLALYTSPSGRPYYDLSEHFARTRGATDVTSARFCLWGLRTLLAGYRSPRGETALATWTAALKKPA